MAEIITASTIQWSDGSNFQGALALKFVPPDLGAANYTEIRPRVSNGSKTLPRALPLRLVIPIVDGVLQSNFLFKQSALSPPNIKVVDFWLDSHGQTIATGGALLAITVDEYTIAVPTLTVPAAETSVPASL